MSIGVVKGTLSVANTTPAVVPVNKGADLITAGIEATAGINYTSYEISAEVVVPGGEDSRYQKVEQVIYVDPAVTAAVTLLDAAFNAPVLNSKVIGRLAAAAFPTAAAANKGQVIYQTDGTVGYYVSDGSAWALSTNLIDFDELIGVGI
jgi:tagatose-1,6-bisphosphate aldolase non-catalytic subunit AgaZ/GatZ